MILGYDLYNATLFSEYLIQFLICFSLMFAVDRLFAPKSARWYFLHVFMNGMISYFAWPDVMFCLTHPKNCYAVDQTLSNTLGWMMGLSGHLYHMIAFDDLRYDDYLHHILMFPFAGLAGLIFLKKPGFNFAIFALTGLPGGIDFVLLTLVKLGYINKYTEKRLNIYIQVWLRAPLLMLNCGIFYAEMFEGHISPWCLIGVILSAWNGMYYMHDTLSNYYHKHYDHVLNMSKNKSVSSPNLTTPVVTNIAETPVRKPSNLEQLINESTEEDNGGDQKADVLADEKLNCIEEETVNPSNDDTEESTEERPANAVPNDKPIDEESTGENPNDEVLNDKQNDDESMDSAPTPPATPATPATEESSDE